MVTIYLKNSIAPFVYNGERNAYERGSFYCVDCEGTETIDKYPVADIFRVVESFKEENLF